MKRCGIIYSLGTGNRSQTEFASLLRSYGIEAVIDVRRFPASRFEHFRKETLAEFLATLSIDYLNLGVELGGFREGGYQAFMSTPEFERGIKAIEEMARRKKGVILCAEKLPWRCHRRFIASELENRGWQVEHIIDDKHTWSPVSKK